MITNSTDRQRITAALAAATQPDGELNWHALPTPAPLTVAEAEADVTDALRLIDAVQAPTGHPIADGLAAAQLPMYRAMLSRARVVLAELHLRPYALRTDNGMVWTRRLVDEDGTARYVPAGIPDCPRLVMASYDDLMTDHAAVVVGVVA